MEVAIRKRQGVRDDLLIVLERTELEQVCMTMPEHSVLNGLYGIARHDVPSWWGEGPKPHTYDPRWQEVPERAEYVKEGWYEGGGGLEPYKPAAPDHLGALGLLDELGRPTRRVVMVGNRNLGNNWGVVAWHRDWDHGWFKLAGEPVDSRTYTCLVWRDTGGLGVEELRVGEDGSVKLAKDGQDLGGELSWAAYGQRVLRNGCITNIQDLLGEFYDLRHVLCLDHTRAADREAMWATWQGYPEGFEAKMREALDGGRPRSRYLHNCIGVSEDRVFILQRHGTPEEVAGWARDAGAKDAVLLDNGGSVFCWAWWVLRGMQERERLFGGYLYSSADFRPPTISAITFVLHGPAALREPAGAVALHIA